MIGTTLGDIRQHLEALAAETGRYYLVCGRSGEHPSPAIGLRFENRPTARAAARATEQYRAALRRYDPQLPRYDVIVCEDPSPPNEPGTASTDSPRESADGRETLLPSATDRSASDESLVDFCHAIAGAMFETVAESPHQSVERAIMDTYLEIAETIETPDELCLRLLESMAIELERRLDSQAQASILMAAAERLSSPSADGEPLELALSRLQSVALFDEYTLERNALEQQVRTRSWTVTLSAYPLGRAETGVVTLPLAIELFRYCSEPGVSISQAEPVDGASSTWEFVLTTSADERPSGLVSVPPK
ncbi:hypothetical protein HALLA_15770 [Halostagnicola larsenii XH-48]|uniref:Uncharacterized protein n=1 Tax=Halostagnicola larsenii XH-48 TaxID=797299 RepID=W0JSR0_9EURY|nr:hypothetical protein [Halostagnicola larsenii]AHG00038.1 hypothetical protein HALLA_15770 [Halostagnicola larsenii XH-48]